MTAREGDYAQAVYDFSGESPNDLSLKVKDVVKVTEVIDSNWVKGHRVHPAADGIFPLAFVDKLILPTIRTGQKIFLACQDFLAEQYGDLELIQGDIIVGTEPVDDSWWSGKNGPLKGMFPVSFVIELEQNDGIRSRSVSCRSNSIISRTNSVSSSTGSFAYNAGSAKLDNPVIAQALVNVTPQLDGELAFQIGDLIEITEIMDNDWMFGRCRGKEGLVSSVCVELLEDMGPESVITETRAETTSRLENNYTQSRTSEHSSAGHNPSEGVSTNAGITQNDGYSINNDSAHNDQYSSSYHPRTATGGSYTSENTRSHDAEITPYARVLYPFTAQYSSEVSLVENQIVSLIQHLNHDWTEGEVDGKRGMFPTSFIEIIVDCPYSFDYDADPKQTSSGNYYDDSVHLPVESTTQSNTNLHSVKKSTVISSVAISKDSLNTGKVLEKQKAVDETNIHQGKDNIGINAGISGVMVVSEGHEIGLVIHSFQAEVDGDVSVSEGDTVEVVKKVDENWIQVKLESGIGGLVPTNHVEIIGLWPKVVIEEKSSKSVNTGVSGDKSEHVTQSDKRHSEVLKTISPICDSHEMSSQNKSTHFVDPQSPAGQGQSKVKSFANEAKSRIPSIPTHKPVIAPKPFLASKPSVMYKPTPKPAAFYTAKPFSSISSSFDSSTLKTVQQQQQNQALPALDSLIEGEISKAKSRTSSQNSTSSSDSNRSSVLPNIIPSVDNALTPSVSSVLSSALNSTNIVSSNPPTLKDISPFDPFSKSTTAPSTKQTKKPDRPKLNSSMSLPAEPDSKQQQQPFSTSNRRSSSCVTNDKPVSNVAATMPQSQILPKSSGIQLSLTSVTQKAVFVNAAYEHDVDEGSLVPIHDSKMLPPARPPPRMPARSILQSLTTSTPQSTVSVAATTLSSKLKAPPPRPVGPRLASAPPRVPLVPLRVAPQADSKPVPTRLAPKAPAMIRASDDNSNKSVTSDIISSSVVDKENVNETASFHQAPRRPPPRPSAFLSPPKRPPPMSSDLIKFSPDRTTQVEEEEEEEEELDEEKKELVLDLKKRIAETVADIKKYEQIKAELQLTIQDSTPFTPADGDEDGKNEKEDGKERKKENEEEDVEDKLLFVDNTLTGLESDKEALLENLFTLSAKEGRSERDQLLSSQNAEEEKRRKEEDALREAELKARRRDQRLKVIQEIVETERGYLFSLHLCQDIFIDGKTPPPPGVDVEFLLGNMEEITDVSQKLLANLEAGTAGKAFEDQRIGNCFTFYFDDMKNTYAPYCRNHDSVITIMEQYRENEEISQYFMTIVERMKEQMNVFDLAGVLIKPVQRILKYPLLLNELLKNTEDSHQDKMDILLAIKAMTDVAKAINEYKRRKDLVYKYKKDDTNKTFGDKLAKLNLHSIKKKSSRMRGRLSTNLGMGLQLRDEVFEKEEVKFQTLEKAVKIFLASSNRYMEQSQETMRCQECLVDNIETFYQGNNCVEATRFKEVNNKVLDLYINMRRTIEDVVIVPLNKLVSLFEAPSKVIQKRFDKLLDYNYQLGKGSDSNDKELETAKNDYEAMNAQLLDELPKFYNLALNILNKCMSAFVTARRDFMDQSLKESCVLLELPSMMSKDNLMSTFNIRHTTAFDHMCMLSFIPRGFNPRVDTVKADRSRQRAKNGSIASEGGSHQLVPTSPGCSQSDSQKAYLHQQYPSEKLFTVITTHNALDVMDISLTEGTLVGVFKELDPMGNKDRWFVDDGATKGFAPRNVLKQFSSVSSRVEEDVVSIHSYDSGGGSDSVQPLSRVDNDRLSTYSMDSVSSMQQQQSYEYEHNQQSSSTTSSLSQPVTQQPSPQPEHYYYALYDFQARHANEASLVAGNYVSVLAFHDAEGNPEWWLVNSESGHGYTPSNYLAPMPSSGS